MLDGVAANVLYRIPENCPHLRAVQPGAVRRRRIQSNRPVAANALMMAS